MGLFDNLKTTLDKVANKTKEAAEVGKIKYDIQKTKTNISGKYKVLGKKLYEDMMQGKEMDEFYVKVSDEITELFKQIETLEKDLSEKPEAVVEAAEKMEDFKENVEEKFDDVKEDVGEKFEEVKEAVEEKVEEVKDRFEEA